MKITDLLTAKTIVLNAKAKSKEEIIKKAVATINNSGAIKNIDEYSKLVFLREKKSTTGVGEGIAIPHAKGDCVKKPALAALVIKDGVDYEALDGEKVQLLFLIAAPNTESNVHLDVLARLSNLLMHPEFKDNLIKAKTNKEFIKIINDAENEKITAENAKGDNTHATVLGVTACPTGIAHTYMAAEALEKTAKEMGVPIKVETNGTGGIKNKLTEEDIKHAVGIIVACDVNVPMERFNGKKILQCGVAKAIHKPKELINESQRTDLPVYFHSGDNSAETKDKDDKKGVFHTIYKHLMTGISHMVPVVVAGGIILALSFFIDSCCGFTKNLGTNNPFANILNQIGKFGLGTVMLPVLAGFIAYSIAGRAGLAAGMIGGLCASKGQFSLLYIILERLYGSDYDLAQMLAQSAAGFLGAIAAGFIAGYAVLFLQRKAFAKMPKAMFGVKSVFLEPICSVLMTGLAMVLVNVPIAFINIGINKGLLLLNDPKLMYILAFIVAALMATDMGGPINKASHYFCYFLLEQYVFKDADPALRNLALVINAAHVVGIMVPPIACAACVALFPQKFKKGDRQTAIADALTGFCGITEGAIPYVAKDPLRVIVSTMVGAGVGGVVSCLGGLGCMSAEGGIFAMIIGSGNKSEMVKCLWGLLGVLVGVIIAAIIMGLLKKDVDPTEAALGKWKGLSFKKIFHKKSAAKAK